MKTGERYDGADLVGRQISGEYRECSFRNATAVDSHWETAQLLSCDLTGINPLGATFKLACSQGSNNQIDDFRVKLFLYWTLQMFRYSEGLRAQIESAIGSDFVKIKRLFETTV